MDPIQNQLQQQQNVNYIGIQSQQQQQHQQPTNSSRNLHRKPYVKIIEQPAGKALRFRYECEGRSAGSIPGANSTPEIKTYPTIEIVGIKARAIVVVSCVTKDKPYRPHPHNLVGKEGCKKGVCTLEINTETMRAGFSNLGIQCVKKKDIDAALKAREDIRVDPFKTGFSHRLKPSSIDLNSVRLCFQVFIEGDQKGRFTQPLAPVVSEPIYDKKAMCDLVICRLCSCSATVLGNTQIILLCEKVAKDDISVRFYEEDSGQIIWEAFGEFQHKDVHKQTAIAFKTPRYRKIDITEPAKVFIQLKRPSDGVTSEALQFEYVPLDSDPGHLKRKRKKANGDAVQFLLQQQQNQYQNDHQNGRQTNINCWKRANISPEIKTEPRDACGMSRVPPNLTPSPHPPSPSNNVYNHNTPSPYDMSTTIPAGAQGNQQVIVPNQQYNHTSTVGGNNAPPPMDARHYNGFGQLTQSYHDNNFGDAGAMHWDIKFNPATAGANNNLNNFNNTTTFAVNNISIADNVAGGTNNCANDTSWNLTSNHFHPHHHQQMQQQYQQHQTQNDGTANPNNNRITNTTAAATNANNINNNEHGLCDLLKFNSDQLVHIDSEDQKMLQLDPEDLQISNLSIST